MKRLTLLVPAIVFAALLAGWLAARIGNATRALPSFAAPRAVEFDELVAPLGEARLEGRVVDAHGAPIPDVSVYARSNSVPFWTVTGPDGRFELDGLADGEIEVALLTWGRAPRLVATHTGQVELTLNEPNPPIAHLPVTARAPLSGRIAHPMRRAWTDPEGYEVTFVPVAPPHELGPTVERRVLADRLGLFTLDDLALGSYQLRVVPEWAAGSAWPDLAAAPYARLEHGSDGGGIVVVLACGALDVTVVDGEEQPLEGALALLQPADAPARVWPPQASDARGRLRFVDLPAGRYALTVRAGEGTASSEDIEIRSGEVTTLRVGPLTVRQR